MSMDDAGNDASTECTRQGIEDAGEWRETTGTDDILVETWVIWGSKAWR